MKKWEALSEGLQLSWVLLFSLLIPLLVGIWLDGKLDTSPLFVLLGAALGILAATVGVARMVLRTFAKASRPSSAEASDPDGKVASKLEESD
jgi:F0F1-type ATP synthase assembly protein I